MEILYPAGNIDYVKSAIKMKADAVYGGFRLWNARNKAINFSISEIKKGIELCHRNNLKFYLTLNTLMFDNEIGEVINILEKNRIFPDAFICTDVGMINSLKKAFPKIPIHISTQFGVHNVDDARFAKKLGAQRIILARELTKSEILEIKNSIDIETEIFVWGSQCISFSGSCFLSSLVNGGTGNRGKCITLCRDKYCLNHDIGNFLYVPDLNCINEIDFPIDSIKIEGRRRNIFELEEIINNIKNKNNKTQSNGFIVSEFPELNHLYEKVNSRQKLSFSHKIDKDLDTNDVWIKEINNNYEYTITPDENSKYLYTEITKPFYPDKKNVSLEFTIKDNKIIKVLYLNHKGEAKYFTENSKNELYFDFNKISIEKIFDLENLNLYSIKYKKEYEGQVPQMSYRLLNKLSQYINKNNKFDKVQNQDQNKLSNKVYIETDDIGKAKQLLNKSIPVILNLADINFINNIELSKLSGDLIFKLPMFDFKNKGWKNILDKFKGKKIMLTKFSQLNYLKNFKFEKIYADYLIPTWNKRTIQLLNKFGINDFCASPELSNEKNLELFNEANETIFLIGGRPTCVYTRQCFKKSLNCKNCNSSSKNLINYDRKLPMKFKCYTSHREIFYDLKAINIFTKPNKNFSFRYIARDEDISLLEKIYNLLKNNDYAKTLKLLPEFKNSYSISLEEDKK